MKTMQWIVRLLPWAWKVWQLLRGRGQADSPEVDTIGRLSTGTGDSLLQLASEILSRTAMLRAGMYGNQPLSDIRKRVLDSLELFSQRCAEQDRPANAIELARFALVAYIDEAVLASNRPDKHEWMAWPLQLELFSEQTAGHKFFECLDKLRQEPQHNIEMLELFYACLRLGYKGAYSLRGDEQLKSLEKGLYLDIEAAKESPDEILSVPVKRKSVSGIAALSLPYWLIVVLSLGGLSGSYLFYQGVAEQRVIEIGEWGPVRHISP